MKTDCTDTSGLGYEKHGKRRNATDRCLRYNVRGSMWLILISACSHLLTCLDSLHVLMGVESITVMLICALVQKKEICGSSQWGNPPCNHCAVLEMKKAFLCDVSTLPEWDNGKEIVVAEKRPALLLTAYFILNFAASPCYELKQKFWTHGTSILFLEECRRGKLH